MLSVVSPFYVLLTALLLTANSCVASAEVFSEDPSPHLVESPGEDTPSDGDALAIDRLIEQLGSNHFSVRRHAEEQLIQLDQEAFDHLQSALRHPDLEIASQARYILHRVRIEWVSANDSETVRALMSSYGELSTSDRRDLIADLSQLEDDEGLGALCRIARFELSSTLARRAALAVLQTPLPGPQRAENLRTKIQNEIGEGTGTTVRWLRLYMKQLQQPQELVGHWLDAIDKEVARLEKEGSATTQELVLQLIDFHISLATELNQPEDVFASLQRKIELPTAADAEDSMQRNLADALQWILEREQWQVFELLEAHYADELEQHRLLAYLHAAMEAARGNSNLAEELAGRAFAVKTADDEQRNRIAETIAELGHHRWAEREWRHLVDTLEPTDLQSMIARISLANWCLHDRKEDKKAAELLAETCNAIEKDPARKKSLLSNDDVRRSYNDSRTQKEYFLACHLGREGKTVEQRKHLEKAYKYNQIDPDVLIAMYRLSEQDESYRKTVLERIEKTRSQIEELIDRYPDEPGKAMLYNHYAWLVSNTEGDYEKAVKYSHRSLELRPGSPSYLDTLGRCYYAVGDLENAIKYQRQAVEKHPQVQILRRQLELFESKLAKRKE